MFRNWKDQPAHIINLAVNVFDDMRYYSVVSNLFGQESSTEPHLKLNRKDHLVLCWSPLSEGWIKINVDVSRRQRTRSSSISYIMRDNEANIIMAINHKLEDYPVVVAECEAVHKAILMTI